MTKAGNAIGGECVVDLVVRWFHRDRLYGRRGGLDWLDWKTAWEIAVLHACPVFA